MLGNLTGLGCFFVSFPACLRLLEGQGDSDNDDDDQSGGVKRADIAAVYGEMGEVLTPRIIPKNTRGEQYRCVCVCVSRVFCVSVCFVCYVCPCVVCCVCGCVWVCVGVGVSVCVCIRLPIAHACVIFLASNRGG